MLDRVPDNLIALTSDEFAQFQTAAATMRNQLDWWRIHGDQALDSTPGYPGEDPITLLFLLLSKCPDEASDASEAGFEFIEINLCAIVFGPIKEESTAPLRMASGKLRRFLAGLWLRQYFFWAIQQRTSADVDIGLTKAQKEGLISSKISRDPLRWDLHEFIEVSANLGIIGSNTAIQTRLAKEYRNLIHPGREQRLVAQCGRGEAMATAASIEQVIRDMEATKAHP
jgi:hypothetical protein